MTNHLDCRLCKETALGVFSREWTKAIVSLNCNTWEGSIQTKNEE
jgi:hypothetical protein